MKKLYENVKFSSLGSLQILAGIVPVNKLCATLSCSKLTIPPIVSGNGPISSLKLTSKTVKSFSSPISGGKHDFKPFCKNMISFSVSDIFPKLAGKQPWNLLFARTITDTGEFPKLSGNSNWNRLWLMKMASRSLSKSSRGTLPSNSLNRRSKNLRVGNSRTRRGNFPANLLLLRSSSKRIFRFRNFCGTVPQNRLEFMWNNARSVSNPSSSGR